MKRLYTSWHEDFVENELEIDITYRRVFNAGVLLYEQIEQGMQCPECILELVYIVNDLVLEHMTYEIETLRKLGIRDWEPHQRDHEYFIERFDIRRKYDFSPKMRVIVCAKMVKEWINLHFFNYDVPDLLKIREHFEVFDRAVA